MAVTRAPDAAIYAAKMQEMFAALRGPSFGCPMIQMVMDYSAGDMARGEVEQSINRFLPRADQWKLCFTETHSFKTTEVGFIAGQYALAPRNPGDPRLIVYINCAPRRDSDSSRKNNEGEKLVYGVLDNDVAVVAVNSKYSLSAMRDRFVSLHETLVSPHGTQFRSRDNFPPFVCLVAQGCDLTPFLGRKLDPQKAIPQFKEGYIGYIDSFGNIKTTYRDSSAIVKRLKPGQRIGIDINGDEYMAHVAKGSFEVPSGSLAFSRGSSGWENPFWEVFKRGGSAASDFKFPQVGAHVKIKILTKNGSRVPVKGRHRDS